MGSKPRIAMVGIVRGEKPFIDEWLLYHRHIGVDHFFIYDDEPAPGLEEFLNPHKEYTTIIRWHDIHQNFTSLRGDRQTKAYTHAVDHLLAGWQWAAFIDVDEFIVLDRHKKLDEFVASLGDAPEISLRRHTFGHNGHYEDPRLVTSELTRRQLNPEAEHYGKSIARCNAIMGFKSVHHCKLKNKHRLKNSNTAHINHYMCRSFAQWMGRPDRGYACDVPILPENAWNFTKEGCLRMFVETVALDWNEHVDEHMLKFKPELERAIKAIQEMRGTTQ